MHLQHKCEIHINVLKREIDININNNPNVMDNT